MARLVFPTVDIESLVHTIYPDADADGVISKAGVGFGRGPKAGHKYWRRVRIMVQGKLGWKYYYNTAADREAYAEHRKKKQKLGNAKRRLRTAVKRKGNSPKKQRAGAPKWIESEEDWNRRSAANDKLLSGHELTAGELAGLKSDFLKDHAKVASAHTALEKLSEDYLSTLMGWESSFEVTITQNAKDHAEGLGVPDPVDPRGKTIDPRRTVETALNLIPRHLKTTFDGCVPQLTLGTRADPLHKDGAAGYCTWGKGRQATQGAGLVWVQQAAGNTVHTLVHEMAHAMHMRMMVDPDESIDGLPTWNEWIELCDDYVAVKHDKKFSSPQHSPSKAKAKKMGKNMLRKDGKQRENPCSAYARTNYLECFAESFSHALMYPRLMSHKSPITFGFMRQFLGEADCRPIITDLDRQAELKAQLEETASPMEREKLRHLIDMQYGLHDDPKPGGEKGLPADDNRLKWWDKTLSAPISVAINDHQEKNPPPNYQDNWEGFIDPPDPEKTGQNGRDPHDRFYEMSYGGRTIYMRAGPVDDNWRGWDPAKAETSGSASGGGIELKPNEIKEIYDENGHSIDRDLAYWHLHQDLFTDPEQVIGHVNIGTKKNPNNIVITVADIMGVDGGLKRGASVEGEAPLTDMQKAIKQHLESTSESRFFLRSLTADMHNSFYEPGHPHVEKGIAQVGDVKLPVKLQSYDAWEKAWQKAERPVGPMTEEQFERDKSAYLAKATMQPHELSHHTFRQRSGTFNYDKLEVAGQEHIDRLKKGAMTDSQRSTVLEKLRKAQPGVRTKNRVRGKFVKPTVVVDSETGEPIFDRKKYVNANPDGTETVIYTVRGADGLHHIEDPMWRELLTPNDEVIRSPEQMTIMLRQAAAERRRTWVSIRTDRKRVAKGKRHVMAEVGDTAHYIHMEVEFDGHGQPRILGKEWKEKLGVDEPRIDMLLRDDPLFGKFRDARPIIEGESIFIEDDTRDPKQHPRLGDVVIIRGKANDPVQAMDRGQEKAGRLVKVIAEKPAGTPPPMPNWDSMPEGSEEFPDETPPGKKKTMRVAEKKHRAQLPPGYKSTAVQREWFDNVFMPAQKQWEATAEEETAKHYPATYIFRVGNKRVKRYAPPDIGKQIRLAHESRKPRPLETELLVYRHEEIDPVTGGATNGSQLRVIPPANGKWDWQSLMTTPGVKITWKIKPKKLPGGGIMPGVVDYYQVSSEEFHVFRDAVGALSLTDAANRQLQSRYRGLRGAKHAVDNEKHVLSVEEIDPYWLINNWDCDLQATLPDGSDFTLAAHQSEVLQKMLDNDGRALAAHYMGTGKTVSTIVAAKMMMKRPDPANPGALHPDNPKRVLVVAPKNTIEQWRDAAANFDDSALVIGAGKNDLPISSFFEDGDVENGKIIRPIPDQQIVVCGPAYFTRHAAALKRLGIDGLAVDEAHQGIKGETNNINDVLQEWNEDMKMMLLLTGTPMTVSPADTVEYVRLLSKGTVWADMDTKTFTDTFLEETTIGAKLGSGQKKGAKVQVKASMRGLLATTLGQWMHIALPKDVKGKALPATYVDANKRAFMQGIQAQLFNLYLSTAGSDIDVSSLSPKERERFHAQASRATLAAKAVANCPGYRQGSTQKYLTFQEVAPNDKGKDVLRDNVFETFSIPELFDANRAGAQGKWPSIDEMRVNEVAVYDMYFEHVLGKPYAEVAGRKITAAQKKAMKAAGWDTRQKIANPEYGPTGIQFRGTTETWSAAIGAQIEAATGEAKKRLIKERDLRANAIEDALAFQRRVRSTLAKYGSGSDFAFEDILGDIASSEGLSLAEAQAMMMVHPVPTSRVPKVTTNVNGKMVTMDADERIIVDDGTPEGMEVLRHSWVSDGSGSRHLLYDTEDWDYKNNRPKPGAQSLMDPGKRESRTRADIAMLTGNAKAEEVGDHIRQFHLDGGGAGENGARQMVLFGGAILASCRTLEAQLRSMGFRDVNEAIEGSPHFDPTDPTTAESAGGSPNGKFFVTYIGKTYTGERDMNVSIFQKVKDIRGRDSEESLFVNKCEAPRKATIVKTGKDEDGKDIEVAVNWMTYRGDLAPSTIRMSQWSPDQRDQVKSGYGIEAPESYVEVDGHLGGASVLQFYGKGGLSSPDTEEGKDPHPLRAAFLAAGWRENKKGKNKRAPFTGKVTSADIIRMTLLIGDPTKEADPEKAEAMKAHIQTLKDFYEKTATKWAVGKKPLTDHQRNTFNNCEMIICSDAAQVGMNLGNAVEMVMYDSLSSPMAEWQRITRCARMLPPAVSKKLLGSPKTEKQDNVAFDPDLPESDDNPKTLDVPVRNADGSFDWKPGSPFGRILEREPELFNAGPRVRQGGTIEGLRLATQFPGSDGKPMPLQSFTQALDLIRARALAKVDEIKSSGDRTARRNISKWEAIAAKATVASNLGGRAARAAFDDFAETIVPGTSDKLIRTGQIKWSEPDLGIYEAGEDIVSLEVETAIRTAIDQLPAAEREQIMNAGFKTNDGMPDAAAVYLALRAAEIMGWMEGNRDKIGAEMRSRASGEVIKDMDVQNRMIEMLSPRDKAILKSKKYLVNVKKIGVAAHVGQVVSHKYKQPNALTGKLETVVERVHTGYEMEHPVRTEVQTKATGTARHVAFEMIQTDIQNGVNYEVTGGFADTQANAFVGVSHVAKSVNLVLDFDRLEELLAKPTPIGGPRG